MTSNSHIEPLVRWVAQESPTRHAAGVNAMMDLVLADIAGLPIVAERIAGREGLGDALLLKAGTEN